MTYQQLRLRDLFKSLGSPPDAGKVIDEVWAHYEEPSRFYHTIEHIIDCLGHVPVVRETEGMTRPRVFYAEILIIELALWYHDVIYDPQKRDNEAQSCELLRAHAEQLHLRSEIVLRACDAIMATRYSVSEPPQDKCAKWVVDLDLHILATPESVFDDFERRVREEYTFVDDDTWIAGRTMVLQRFLDRDWIYQTALYRRRFEGEARRNLKRSLARLARGEVPRMVR